MTVQLPRNFDSAQADQVLEQARPALDLPPDSELRVETVRQTTRGVRIHFSYTRQEKLTGIEYAQAEGISIQVRGEGDLRFNSRGQLVACDLKPPDPRQVKAIGDNVAKLIQTGQVYVPAPGEEVDPDKLRQAGKAWYLEQDESGARRLRRAWIT